MSAVPSGERQREEGRRGRALAGVLPSPTAWPGARRLRARFAVGREALLGRLRGAWELEVERRRLFLWLPVAMGLGVLAYFAADREPAAWAGPAGFALSAAAAWGLRRRQPLFCAALALAAVFAGFTAAGWRTASVAGPMLDRPRIGQVSGFVESVEARDAGVRLVLVVTGMAGLDAADRPRRVRVNAAAAEVSPADHVTGVMRLLPPPGPARPGGYDFARDAFFRGLGAVGSVSGKLVMTPPPGPPPADLAWRAAIDGARNALTARIAAIGGGQAGAMAAALVTGKRGLIGEETNADLRAAGIYHIVSISGLHMVLAAGTIFWLVRALLALSQTLALSWPIKKVAAIAALLGATAYCVFSGAEVATVRSLIMTAIMLGAILVDRPALSLRNLAIAAIIVLLREPDALLGPSFQMSFGAVAALVAFAERWQERDRAAGPPDWPWPLRPVLTVLSGILVTTLLASAATAPFGAYHFQTFNPFGLIGNALALPFVSLIVMPAAVAGVLLYPFGLDWPAWAAMGLASEFVLKLAHWVATLDHSTLVVPAFGAPALACFALTLLWLCLWSTWLRLFAILPLALGVAVAARPERPTILVEREGGGIAVRGGDGRLLIAGRLNDFTLRQWLAADGDARPSSDASLTTGPACDRQGCVIRTPAGGTVSYARDQLAVIEDCRRADVVVTPLAWTSPCKALLIDRTRLTREGAIALVATPRGVGQRSSWRVMAAADPRAERPWHRRSPSPALTPATPSRASPPRDDDGFAASPLQ